MRLTEEVQIKLHVVSCGKLSSLPDSPHSAQTLCACTIYETARNQGGPSSLLLPVKAENKSIDLLVLKIKGLKLKEGNQTRR